MKKFNELLKKKNSDEKDKADALSKIKAVAEQMMLSI